MIQDQLNKKMIEPVNEEEELEVGKAQHYLPHREVIRLDKNTTKIHVVYDASAKRNGPSLNDCFYSGPPLTPLIFDVLTRFQAHRVALTANIDKAFLNVVVTQEHRNYLRFLWIDDIHSDNPRLVLRRFTRVVFGVNSSLFLLNGTIRHHMNFYQTVDWVLSRELNTFFHYMPGSHYNSLILLLFDYGDIVWGDKNNTVLMEHLQVLQNNAARLMLDLPRIQTSASQALNQLNWKPLIFRRRLNHRCVAIFKCLNNLVNFDFNLKKNKDIQSRS